MNSGPSGFCNAHVTKGVVVTSAVVSLLAGSRGLASSFNLSYQALLRGELWRLLTSSTMFQSSPEIIFGLYLVYFFRVFERQVGSNKYAVFALFSSVVSILVQVCALFTLRGVEGDLSLSPGPYGLLFACYVPFCFDIPVSTRFCVLSVDLSDKSFVYLAGLQLLLSSWKQSLIPGLSGVLAGFLYRANFLGVRKWKFPDAVANVAGRLFAPLASRPPAANPRRTAGTQVAAGGPEQAPAGLRMAPRQGPLGPTQGFQDQLLGPERGAPPPIGMGRFLASAPLPPPPSEEAISTLEAMGFDRNAAVQALTQARNDVEMATNLLLGS